MKQNNLNMAKEGRPASRAISPSFRTGPRQRPSDASTDEIVRFVREYQRCKPSPQVQTISALKTKAVLPGIERKQSDQLTKSQDKRLSMSLEEEDSVRHSVESTNNMEACRVNGSMEDEVDRDSDIYADKYDVPFIGKNNDLHITGSGSHAKSRSDCKSQDVYEEPTMKRHSSYDLSSDRGEKFSALSNGATNGRKSYTHAKRLSESNQIAIIYSHKNDQTSVLVDQSFLQNNSSRPNALRQLPPIVNKETESSVISRPSAPSPNKASPRLGSASDDSCGEDNNDDEENHDHDKVEDEQVEEHRLE